MKIYKVQKMDTLLVTTAYIRGPKSFSSTQLLIDTGAAYTMIDQNILASIGCFPIQQQKRVVTASRIEVLPVVRVDQFNCLGQFVENNHVLAHTFPVNLPFDGVLGMSFLQRFPIELRPYAGEVVLRDR